MKTVIITQILKRQEDGERLVRMYVYTPDPEERGTCVANLNDEGELVDYNTRCHKTRYKCDAPSEADWALARAVAAKIGAPESAEWLAYGTVATFPLSQLTDAAFLGRLEAAEAAEAAAAQALLAETAKANALRDEINGMKVVEFAP